ncbi:DUF6174 domain-containing protein [Kaarinaea lacus]
MRNYCQTLLAVIFVIASASCSSAPSQFSTQQQFDNAMGLWQQKTSSNYDFTLKQQCYCLDELTKPLRISVREGTIVAVKNIETAEVLPQKHWKDLYTVEAWFTVIENAIIKKAEKLEVHYDAKLGFPTTIDIDMHSRLADDNLRASITDLVLID